MDVVTGDTDTNVAAARDGISRATAQGAQVVLLPELFTAGYVWREGEGYSGSREAADFALDFGACEGALAMLADAARCHGIWVVGGSVPEVTGNGIYNTTPVFNPRGRLVHRYRKVHLIGLMDEDRHMVAGDTCHAFALGEETAGIFICYDLRFPELGRNLFIDGARLLLVPAQWPSARASHWRALLVARAIENQAYVVATNRVGRGGPDTFSGGSLVVAPDGEVLAEGGSDKEVVLADLDFSRVDALRDTLPCGPDRRPGVYRLGPTR